MTFFLDGGQERTKRREDVEALVESEPWLQTWGYLLTFCLLWISWFSVAHRPVLGK